MSRRPRGFTLIEMAIVLLIVSLLLGGGLSLIGAQAEHQRVKDSQKALDDAKEALIGYALANGRLPSPATAATTGVENPLGGGNCNNSYDGFLPATTLGLPGTDANGYLTDAWGRPIRYAVTRANGNAATTANGIRTTTLATFAPDLRVCSTATGIAPPNCSGAATTLSNNAVAIILSTGSNPANVNTDETANQNNDPVFVSHTPTATFDDQVTWLAPGTFYNRMVQAGALP